MAPVGEQQNVSLLTGTGVGNVAGHHRMVVLAQTGQARMVFVVVQRLPVYRAAPCANFAGEPQ